MARLQNKSSPGFSIVELMAAMGIVVVLVHLAMVGYRDMIKRARRLEAKKNLRTLFDVVQTSHEDFSAVDTVDGGGAGSLQGAGKKCPIGWPTGHHAITQDADDNCHSTQACLSDSSSKGETFGFSLASCKQAHYFYVYVQDTTWGWDANQWYIMAASREGKVGGCPKWSDQWIITYKGHIFLKHEADASCANEQEYTDWVDDF